MPERLGLIAGWGHYPVCIARKLQESGHEVCCVGVLNHANEQALLPYCHQYQRLGMAKLGRQAKFFRRCGVTRATMAGKIFKTALFEKMAWVRHMPDLAFMKHFYRQLISRTEDCNDDAMLLTAIRLFSTYGIDFVPATDFAPELLVKPGNLTNQKLTKANFADIEFGWKLAKDMGGLDVGQSVVVKRSAVLAVEAVEGTDECIRRAGQLCPAGGFTVVKVAKPNQDMRFDVPTVGLGTLETIRAAGGSVLAIEANKTIILEQQEMIDFATKHGIAVVALESEASQIRRAA